MKKALWLSFILAAFLLAVLVLPVRAQSGDFGVHLRRDFGYGAGSNVRGTFTISLTGDESQVLAVDFLIDEVVMASIEEAPFRFQFHTDDYGVGVHRMSARVFLHDGRVETTPVTQLNFLSPEEERGSMVTLFVGLGVAIVFGLVIFGLVQMLVIKKKPTSTIQPGERRRYGLLGGTICPKCGRAFPRHIWGMNLLIGKFDRCDHCGKWSMTVRATPEALKAAEEAELKDSQADQAVETFQGQVSDALEDTRFVDQI